MIWTMPLQIFMKEHILTRMKIIVIVSAHTVEKGSEIGWLLELQNLECEPSNREIYSVQEANAGQKEQV